MNRSRRRPSKGAMRRWTRWVGAVTCATLVLWLAVSAAALNQGQRAPEIGLRDLDGQPVRLAALRGKVVLVDFWASWCEPCREEMPFLNRLYREHRDDGLVVIGVSVDRRERNVGRFLRRTRVSFPIVHDADQAVVGRYSPPTMPSSYLIDRRGIVRYVHEGFRAGDAERITREIEGLLRQR